MPSKYAMTSNVRYDGIDHNDGKGVLASKGLPALIALWVE